ncbi:hypothetical protein F5X68DRAFT_197020 [Plectosphaerella plurivora]|uniref:Uncharacterized protein n=1 Tax=Plectosphaerella plurivora TaxID=936078 RepID=A0A9P8VME9_9PEZI|nr:hypothetical protein F5X68DRAFT_197020 [Plectosphaerella plurivora]
MFGMMISLLSFVFFFLMPSRRGVGHVRVDDLAFLVHGGGICVFSITYSVGR